MWAYAQILAWLLMDLFDNFTIMSWNIRGASSKLTRRHVRDIVKTHSPSVFCIYETHVLFSKMESFWDSIGYTPLFIQEAQGHSGGIWVLSCVRDVTFTLIDTMTQAITFEVRVRNAFWYCSAIYASPVFANCCRLWDYLYQLREAIVGPWIILGDFNEVLLSSEVAGGNFHPSRACLLAQLLTDCNLLDLRYTGGLFTWRKNIQLGGHVRKKLDRIVADVDWQLAFAHSLVEVLPQHASNHNPLLLSCSKFRSRRAKLFHFQAAWISYPDYEILVRNSWNLIGADVATKPDQVRKWSVIFNSETFGNIFKALILI